MLYLWYDNEYGYSNQVIRLLQHIAGLELPGFPKEVERSDGKGVEVSLNGRLPEGPG